MVPVPGSPEATGEEGNDRPSFGRRKSTRDLLERTHRV
jgi:hypothetical protein